MTMLATLTKAYQGKTILLTGHTGFKGSWLALWLTLLGANVVGFSLRPPSEPALFNLLGLANRLYASVIGDIRQPEVVRAIFQQYHPDVVFHLAAQALVRRSYTAPHETFETNVMGTLNVLDACLNTPETQVVVNITSDKCYENVEQDYAYQETDPMGGYDPYSASKGCAELLTASYRKSFFAPLGKALASARAGNVIGGGDWAMDRLIPDCVRSLAANQPIVIRSPKAIRPWQHVLEPLAGYLTLGQHLIYGSADKAAFQTGWNFGPKPASALDVETVVRQVIHCWGSGNYQVDTEPKPHEAHLLQLDITKAERELGFTPVLSAEDAIDWTVAWYQAYYRGAHVMTDMTELQLNNYMKRMESASLAMVTG
jgi:CDP-glucose 4,6-dehydratase